MTHARGPRGRAVVRRRGLGGLALATLAAVGLMVGTATAGTAEPTPIGGDAAGVDVIGQSSEPVPDQYIVMLKAPEPDAEVRAQSADLADEYDGTLLHSYDTALSGFSVRMSKADAEALARDPSVAAVFEDGYVHVDATESPAPWGLDRIDQRDLPLDNSYSYESDGSGTTVYVIDTGIRTSHSEFEGRARVGIDLIGDGADGQDCHGHGTHVASTIGGKQYGVAKNVNLVAVRALSCMGTGTEATLIAAIDWVTAHHEPRAVANLSLGGAASAPVDLAVQNSIASGVTFVVSAGNDGADACDKSPARVPGAITVAATSSADARPLFSNFGTCVDLFAPGVSIVAAGIASDTATATKSGTSMAAPSVAGLAARYLEGNPSASPSQVQAAILANATTGRVANRGVGSPDALAYAGFVGAPPPGPSTPVTRIYGQDAVGTSLAISQAMYGAGSASAVVLARSDYFADALAGGPLATTKAGPLLITPGAGIQADLDPRVLAEIQRVLPAGRTVYILGGTLALSSAIDASLRAAGYSVERVQGANQFATAVAIADELGNPPIVFEATGLNFADALSAVPAAIQARGAILLTNGNVQAPETAAYLAARPSTKRYAIGGPLAAAGADPQATAVYGQDLFATSAVVASTFFPAPGTVGAATGLDFPDALSGGVFMGAPGHVGPMILVAPTAPIPAPVSGYLARTGTTSMNYLFGGPLAVGDDVAVALGKR